jgi:hypothetical protein
VISPSQIPLLENTKTLARDKHPCPRWDSNPRSQQALGRMPTPYIARPLEAASRWAGNLEFRLLCIYSSQRCWLCNYISSDFVTLVSVMSTVVWTFTQCTFVDRYPRFGAIFCLILQGRWVFYPKDAGSKLLETWLLVYQITPRRMPEDYVL